MEGGEKQGFKEPISFVLLAVLHVGEAGGTVPLSDRRLLQAHTAIMEPLLVTLSNVSKMGSIMMC